MSEQEIPSPCVGVCSIDEGNGYCQGCFRTLDEIRQWWDLDNAGKAEIIQLANARESAVFGQ